ncbi:MAG TPA: hypothetical protein VFI95_20765 [Terriglobales bacterium]|nr:hypothetical protein [Terriglobales bacterium]
MLSALAIMALVVAIAAVIERWDFPGMHYGSRLGTPGEPHEQSNTRMFQSEQTSVFGFRHAA